MKTKPNDLAYPIKDVPHLGYADNKGLTKREYFAALALQGLATPCTPGGHNLNDSLESKHKAQMAVRLADTLIEQLNKEGK